MNFKDLNVLVVDDSRVMRRIVLQRLQCMGVEKIHEAASGRSALQFLVEEEGIDLILSDWSMPGISGLDFLKEVRSRPATKEIPFVLLTAEAQLYTILLAFKTNVSSYITKPFTQGYFSDIVGRVLKEDYDFGKD